MSARFGRLFLAASTCRTPEDTSAVVAVGWVPWRAILGVGIGWDEQVPLSIWPRFYDHATPKGNRARGFAWCGVFIQHTSEN